MYCRNCGKTVAENAVACMACGCAPKTGSRFCWSCGVECAGNAVVCVKCGVSLAQAGAGGERKSRMTAGLLNLLLPLVGISGIGRIYLGYTSLGVTQLVVGLLTCGIAGLWSLIDGAMILGGTPPNDAQGNPLT